MSLYKSPLQAVVESINRLNNLDLIAEEYNFSAPDALATPRGAINTEVTLTAKGINSAYSGTVTVGYQRLDLASLATQVTLVVPLMSAETTHDIAFALNRTFGTAFGVGDIVLRTLTTEEKTFPSTVNLVAAPGSYGWIGSVDVGTRPGGYQLPTYLTNRALSGMNYPSPVTTRPYAHMYSYWRDFSDHYAGLSTVQEGTAQLEAVRQALQTLTGDAWVLSGQARYSLEGATVTNVAEIRLNPDNYNDTYDFGITVLLDDTKSLGLTGSLVLHFNEPFEI